jgi:hypothetical protein
MGMYSRTVRTFLTVEAVTFLLAAAIHAGFLIEGYAHREARLAETVIALVLLAGLSWSCTRPGGTRTAGLLSQGFALLGTAVGLFTIAVGVGPRTLPDVVYHVAIVIVLACGLLATARGRPSPRTL